MSDFAPNYTARYRLTYSSLGKQHNLTMRHFGASALPSDGFVSGVVGFINASSAIRYSDWTIIGAAGAAQDSDTFLPLDLPDGLAAGAATPGAVSFRPVFFSCQGISTEGNRASVYLFGCALDPAQPTPGVTLDYRITSLEDATTAGIIDALESIPDLIAIDRNTVFWHPYINIGYNAYYQRRARVG